MTDTITEAEIVPSNLESTPSPAPETPPTLTWDQESYVHFEAYMVEFARKINNYKGSRRQLQRAWINAAIAPLNKEPLHFSYPEEEEIFNLFNELNSAKLLLMMNAFAIDGKVELKESFFEQFKKSEVPQQTTEREIKNEEEAKDQVN